MGLFMKILLNIRTLEKSEAEGVAEEVTRTKIVPHMLRIQF